MSNTLIRTAIKYFPLPKNQLFNLEFPKKMLYFIGNKDPLKFEFYRDYKLLYE